MPLKDLSCTVSKFWSSLYQTLECRTAKIKVRLQYYWEPYCLKSRSEESITGFKTEYILINRSNTRTPILELIEVTDHSRKHRCNLYFQENLDDPQQRAQDFLFPVLPIFGNATLNFTTASAELGQYCLRSLIEKLS